MGPGAVPCVGSENYYYEGTFFFFFRDTYTSKFSLTHDSEIVLAPLQLTNRFTFVLSQALTLNKL